MGAARRAAAVVLCVSSRRTLLALRASQPHRRETRGWASTGPIPDTDGLDQCLAVAITVQVVHELGLAGCHTGCHKGEDAGELGEMHLEENWAARVGYVWWRRIQGDLADGCIVCDECSETGQWVGDGSLSIPSRLSHNAPSDAWCSAGSSPPEGNLPSEHCALIIQPLGMLTASNSILPSTRDHE